LTASSRNAQIGWQLYVMRLDGSQSRQITEGGNPFYARFAPDGRRLLYTDGTTEERRGIWIVDFDGTHRRRVLDIGRKQASACWSPDSTHVAITTLDFDNAVGGRPPAQLIIMEPDRDPRLFLGLPEGAWPDMPDWR
jgi:Tol biopolymer transport system component